MKFEGEGMVEVDENGGKVKKVDFASSRMTAAEVLYKSGLIDEYGNDISGWQSFEDVLKFVQSSKDRELALARQLKSLYRDAWELQNSDIAEDKKGKTEDLIYERINKTRDEDARRGVSDEMKVLVWCLHLSNIPYNERNERLEQLNHSYKEVYKSENLGWSIYWRDALFAGWDREWLAKKSVVINKQS